MTDPATGPRPAEDGGLARRVAVAALQVSQAAGELHGAGERLMAAEEAVREAETRWRAVDEQLAQRAAKNAELVEMLRRTREAKDEAGERASRTEQRLELAIERARRMEDRIRELEALVEEAEARPQVTLIVDDERTALQEAVAADVRRPLTSILGLTLALKHADPHSPEGADMVRQLAANARRLDRLVGEMLAIDQIASGEFALNLRRTDLEALVRRVVEDSADLAGREVQVETEHVAIEVDPALAEQIVETLLSNAGRRTTPGTPVWVEISSDQGGAVIAVDDTGPEVPTGLRGTPDAAGSDEGPAARRQPRGATGLTLLTRLAEIHGGRAWVEERPGGGASFRVFLPTTQETRPGSHEDPPDDRAAARGVNADEERAIAFAKALVEADEEERTRRFDPAAVVSNGHRSTAEDAGDITL